MSVLSIFPDILPSARAMICPARVCSSRRSSVVRSRASRSCRCSCRSPSSAALSPPDTIQAMDGFPGRQAIALVSNIPSIAIEYFVSFKLAEHANRFGNVGQLCAQSVLNILDFKLIDVSARSPADRQHADIGQFTRVSSRPAAANLPTLIRVENHVIHVRPGSVIDRVDVLAWGKTDAAAVAAARPTKWRAVELDLIHVFSAVDCNIVEILSGEEISTWPAK